MQNKKRTSQNFCCRFDIHLLNLIIQYLKEKKWEQWRYQNHSLWTEIKWSGTKVVVRDMGNLTSAPCLMLLTYLLTGKALKRSWGHTQIPAALHLSLSAWLEGMSCLAAEAQFQHSQVAVFHVCRLGMPPCWVAWIYRLFQAELADVSVPLLLQRVGTVQTWVEKVLAAFAEEAQSLWPVQAMPTALLQTYPDKSHNKHCKATPPSPLLRYN